MIRYNELQKQYKVEQRKREWQEELKLREKMAAEYAEKERADQDGSPPPCNAPSPRKVSASRRKIVAGSTRPPMRSTSATGRKRQEELAFRDTGSSRKPRGSTFGKASRYIGRVWPRRGRFLVVMFFKK